MKKQNNLIKLVFTGIIIFSIFYLSTTYLMRDKSPNWCNLTLGTYDSKGIEGVNFSELNRPPMEMGIVSPRTVYGCTGGIFGFFD